MSRALLTLATALLMPQAQVQVVVRTADPIPDFGNFMRPACHAKPHEPPAHILNRKKKSRKK